MTLALIAISMMAMGCGGSDCDGALVTAGNDLNLLGEVIFNCKADATNQSDQSEIVKCSCDAYASALMELTNLSIRCADEFSEEDTKKLNKGVDLLRTDEEEAGCNTAVVA